MNPLLLSVPPGAAAQTQIGDEIKHLEGNGRFLSGWANPARDGDGNALAEKAIAAQRAH
jgi:hypothetical protein